MVNYFTAPEVMERLQIKHRSALSEISKEIPFPEINDNEKVDPYRGKKLLYVRNLDHRSFFPKNYFYEYIGEEEKKRNLKKDLDLIDDSKNTLDILGINALGPLHLGRESIIDFNKRGGILQILLLNPLSIAFKDRERQEEEFNNIILGRLRAELIASIGICADIINFSQFKENIIVKTHSTIPKMALVISDRNYENATLHCNVYPMEHNVRGLMGSHKLKVAKREKPEQFNEYCSYFIELWKNGNMVEVTKMNNLLPQLNKLLISQEMFENEIS